MRFAVPFAAVAALASVSADATLIQGAGSLAGANSITLPAANYTGAGPQTLGPITWSSTLPTSLYGSTGGFSFLGNGGWDSTPFIGLNGGFDPNTGGYATMSLTFANPVSGFLAELNWRLGTGNANSSLMAAYDVNDNLILNLEYGVNDDRRYYYLLANNGNFNVVQPGYYGFSYNAPVIKRIMFANGFISARNMSWTGPAVPGGGTGGVPEPASWALLIAGFGLVGAAQRRRGLTRVSA
ncbi:PEPxxWA-CTERM sorting domain-containing protein [Sandarakinorhabdus oryzae]|uniref:PEPxxWA-CTERM sorting domain-containing protein n=1 Tax=Sandarakinorhabdus oryzae TaxID=2675220 RepID=UPI001F2DB196|nr:PEPxxWA-CTERM sorting domain-containing protein [Sandarakinorhabdus oryzae]